MAKTALFILAVFLALASRAETAPLFACSGEDPDVSCDDRELVALDKAVDVRFNTLVAKVDPLTALLLRRDQRWFAEILDDSQLFPDDRKSDRERARKKNLLAARLKVLDAIAPGSVAATPEGEWANALGSLRVRKGAGDTLEVALRAKLRYADLQETLACALSGSVRPEGPLLVGDVAAADDPMRMAHVRLRLQGATLRLVHDYQAYDKDHRPCNLEITTGSFFATNPAQPGKPSVLAARTVSPSFSCAGAQNSDEEEICGDPELAARDVEIARVYSQTIRRLEPHLAAALRADQRAYARDNATEFATFLHPPWAKETSMVHSPDYARRELRLRLDERLAFLANLDEKRAGLTGLWAANNAVLTIAPAEGKTEGTLTAKGRKWVAGDRRRDCDFDSDGRIENGVFKANAAFPRLSRDGPALVISPEDPDGEDAVAAGGPPSYCRMGSAKARLFPVKAGIEFDYDRIR